METLTALLAKVFGVADGASLVNKAVGVVSYAAFIPVIMYLFTHRDESIHFETSLGFLCLIVAVALLVLEVARRSRSSGGN